MALGSKLSFRRKALFSAIAVAAFFGLAEIALALFGIRADVDSGDPGLAGGARIFERDGDVYRTRRFEGAAPFNTETFLAERPANGLRIFTLGGSSAYGHPWGADVAFTSLVGDVLAATRPDRRVEAVNVGGISYGMRRVRAVADEILEYAPDVLIVYAGHNEFAERVFPADGERAHSVAGRLARLASRTRLYTAIRRGLGRATPDTPDARFAVSVRRSEARAFTSAERDAVEGEFRSALRDLVRSAHARGVKVLLATVPANLSRWRPNHSIVEAELDADERARWAVGLSAGRRALEAGALDAAAAELGRALELAPRHAETHYLVGQLDERLGRWADARLHYRLAADLDASPIRRTTAINRAISDVAAEEGALLVDVDRVFEERSEHGLVGLGLIDDYAHPSREGHEVIARAVFAAIEDAGWVSPPTEDRERVFDAVVAARARAPRSTPPSWLYNQGYLLAHQGQLRRAIAKFRDALALAPAFEPALESLAAALLADRDLPGAARAVDDLVARYPENVVGRILGGRLRLAAGDPVGAVRELREAVRLDPESAAAHGTLARALYASGRPADAERAYREALRIDPNDAESHVGLARVLVEADRGGDAALHYRSAIRLRPTWPLPYNNLADLLAKDALLARADPTEAVALAETAIRLDGGPTAPTLDTLAAAQAAAGRPDDAVRTAEAALASARETGAEGLAERLALRLERYRDAARREAPPNAEPR